MSLDQPTYLSSLQNNIRARPIPWDGAVRSGTITEEQLTRIRAVDKVRKEQRKTTVEGELGAYKKLFLGSEDRQIKSILEQAGKRADVVQYVLVLLGDLLEGMPFSHFSSTDLEDAVTKCHRLTSIRQLYSYPSSG